MASTSVPRSVSSSNVLTRSKTNIPRTAAGDSASQPLLRSARAESVDWDGGDHVSGKDVVVTRNKRQSVISDIGSGILNFSVADLDVLPDSLHASETFTPPRKTCFNRFKGILCMLFASVVTSLHPSIFFYAMNVRKLPYSQSCYLVYASSMYCCINMIPFSIVVYYKRWELLTPFRNRRLILIYFLRGLSGSGYLLLQWYAISFYGKPAPVSVILAMAPIFVYINAYFVLKEALGIVPIVNAFVAMGGVLIMNVEGLQNPGEGKDTLIGTALGLIAMLVISWTTILIRLLKEVHPFVLNLSFGILGTILVTTFSAANKTLKLMDDPEALRLCAATATISTISNTFFNLALRYEQAGIISLVKTSEVIFNFVYQATFFDMSPNIFDGIGAFIVILGVLCVTFRKIVNDAAEDSWVRRHFAFLLK